MSYSRSPPLAGSARSPGDSRPLSRATSAHGTLPYAPLNPSQLRMSHEPGASPGSFRSLQQSEDGQISPFSHEVHVDEEGIRRLGSKQTFPFAESLAARIEGSLDESPSHEADAHSHLLQACNEAPACGLKTCNHGTFSPRPTMRRSYVGYESQSLFGGGYGQVLGDLDGASRGASYGTSGDVSGGWTPEGRTGKKMSTTQWLAKRHGVKNPRTMYVRVSNSIHLEMNIQEIFARQP